MDSSMNFYEENIRPPDISKKETLLQNNINEYDKDFSEALYQSLKLYQNEVQKYEDLEKKLLEQQQQEIQKRKDLVKPILFEFNRIKNYDKQLNELFQIIEPILDSYCNLVFENCILDKQTYYYIFNGLTKTRINIDILMSIIKRE
jgi:seryl-tRNA(Sec) selenium transferase